MFEHALLFYFALHLIYYFHVDVLLHHYLVHPEDVCKNGNESDAHNLFHKNLLAVHSHKNRRDIEKHQKWSNYLVEYCLFEENEKEDLSALGGHYLENAVKLPAEGFLEVLLLFYIPQLYESTNVKIKKDHEHVLLETRWIRIGVEGE